MRSWITVAALAAGLGALFVAPGVALGPRTTGDAGTAAALRSALDGTKGHRGIAVAVVEHGRVSTAGVGDRGDGEPVTAATPFQVGSIGKVLTGMLLADLAGDGVVRPDDTLRATLPGSTSDITLAELASHRSGLPRLVYRDPLQTVRLVTANLHGRDPYAGQDARWITRADQQPGEGRGTIRYSNFGAALLGQALAGRTGVPYPELVHRRILAPLGMDATTYDVPAGHAAGSTAGGRTVEPWTGPGWAPAGVGLWSTVDDLARLLVAVQWDRAPGVDATVPRFAGDDGTRIGYGWFTTSYGGREVLWHNGGAGGFRAYAGLDRAQGRGVVVLANTDRAVDDVGLRLLGVTPPDRGPSLPSLVGAALGVAFSFLAGLTLIGTAKGSRTELATAAVWAVASLALGYRLGTWTTVPGWVWAAGVALTAGGLVVAARRWRDAPHRGGWRRWTATAASVTAALLAVWLVAPV
ncbi:serine hydrolase domain-containing protein [Dactylosporangium sucinum]|uniref:Beta-lactamase-related domain-containing protein n=1 Tax=Dactylosporangium sucinum TaxID=1424081 RepID=A0A917X2P8_9ACTN|nr:serine hydrolase domain-containing protein [Dactylosporangium sucinum]GGM55737.1 hypothetical protein GCM10007977_066790 [Dactylosporangium sucinum]